MKRLLPLSLLVVLTGCASGPSSLSYSEASAFERSVLARESTETTQSEKIYVQPLNKIEDCKLPSSRTHIERTNFRAYWDGECKNGFAFGFGREIAISDTHHIEEITVYDGIERHSQQPRVITDFINNEITYMVGKDTKSVHVALIEEIENSYSGFNVRHTLVLNDELGRQFAILSSPFDPTLTYINTFVDKSLLYRFTDKANDPFIQQGYPNQSVEVIDVEKSITGVLAWIYPNKTAKHLLIKDGVSKEVKLPKEYTDYLVSKYVEVKKALAQAPTRLQRAQQIEREYLFKACNGSSGIKNLDNAIYTKICTWRDQFKEPYAIASENYQRRLENQRQLASTAQQKMLIQQQIDMQQQMLQQQAVSQLINIVNQSAQQVGQSYSPPYPQVQPIPQVGGSKLTCQTIGSITTCR